MKSILIAALISAAGPAFADCGVVCQSKCRETAGDFYDQCVAQWSVINSRMGMDAVKCQGKISLDVPASKLTKKYLMRACQ